MTPLFTLLVPLLLSAEPASPRAVVMLLPDERAPILGPMVQSIRSQLSDLPVTFRTEPVARVEETVGLQMRAVRTSYPGALAVVWLELLSSEPMMVYVADPQRNRLLARTVDWDGASGHLEALGIIVRSSVQALLAGQSIGFETPHPRSIARTAPVDCRIPESAKGRLGLALQMSYSPSWFASDLGPMQALDLSAELGLGRYAFVAARHRLALPFLRRAMEYVVALVWRHPTSLGIGARLQKGRLLLQAQLDGIIDPVGFEIRDVGPWSARSPSQSSLFFGLGPAATAAWELTPGFSLAATAGADIYLGTRDYVLEGTSTPRVLLQPWTVQPRVLAGVRWDVF